MLVDPGKAGDGVEMSPHQGQSPESEGTGKRVGRTDRSLPTTRKELRFGFP